MLPRLSHIVLYWSANTQHGGTPPIIKKTRKKPNKNDEKIFREFLIGLESTGISVVSRGIWSLANVFLSRFVGVFWGIWRLRGLVFGYLGGLWVGFSERGEPGAANCAGGRLWFDY